MDGIEQVTVLGYVLECVCLDKLCVANRVVFDWRIVHSRDVETCAQVASAGPACPAEQVE